MVINQVERNPEEIVKKLMADRDPQIRLRAVDLWIKWEERKTTTCTVCSAQAEKAELYTELVRKKLTEEELAELSARLKATRDYKNSLLVKYQLIAEELVPVAAEPYVGPGDPGYVPQFCAPTRREGDEEEEPLEEQPAEPLPLTGWRLAISTLNPYEQYEWCAKERARINDSGLNYPEDFSADELDFIEHKYDFEDGKRWRP